MRERKYFSLEEVYNLVLWAKNNEYAPRVSDSTHPTIYAQFLLQAGLCDYDFDVNYDPFAQAYMAVFAGASVRDVAKNVYCVMYARKKISPYAVRIEPWYPCKTCDQTSRWRVNTVGIDGEGVDLCERHVAEVLRQPGNERLLEQARLKVTK